MEINQSGISNSGDELSMDEGINALLGIVNPKLDTDTESSEIEASDTDDNIEEEVEEEVFDETPEAEIEEEGDIEDVQLEPDEFDYLVGVKDFLAENEIKDLDTVKKSLMLHGDYTRKTQSLAEERKTFETTRDQQLSQTAELLEVAQAMVYGQAPKVTSAELARLKETDIDAYEQALEQRVLYDQRKSEIDQVVQKVTQQHQEALQQQQAQLYEEQSQRLLQLEPSFADPEVAKEKVKVMSDYFASIGGNPEQLATVSDAIVLKVLHDAAYATQKEVKRAKSTKKGPTKVVRRGVSQSKAKKQAASKARTLKNAVGSDGSFTKESATDLILKRLNGEL